MICSTLSGMMAIKHPTLGVLVREDGKVLSKVPGGHHDKYRWKDGSITCDGYYVITIYDKQYKMHRIIAEAFIPNPDNKPTVDHINRVRTDNRVHNLRWATYREQSDNSSWVIDRADYGVRAIENKSEYDRNYHNANRDHLREYNRKYNIEHRDEIRERKRRKKQEKLAAKDSQ